MVSPMAMNTLLKLFRIFTKIHEYIRQDKLITGVTEKYFETAKVNRYSSNSFIADVVVIGNKLLPVSL